MSGKKQKQLRKINQKTLRVFWNSNAMFSMSGYGQQMAELLPLIRDDGYPLAICNFFGQEGTKFMLDGILNYPKINHVYGGDAMIHHARDFNADVVFTLQDVWVLNPQDLQQVNRWIPYIPIDHEPIPRVVAEKLKYAYRVVAMSKFGQEELKKKGIASTYIPHMVDTTIFKPQDKAQIKKNAGFSPDTFILGMVAANKDNPPRKSFQEVLDAFKMFKEKVPNSILYIHTNPDFPGGFPIKEYAEFIGILGSVFFPEPYQLSFNTTKEGMSKIYNAMDVFLMPSFSEGFGIGFIEAQACGIPVIGNNFTSMKELVKVGKTGYLTDVASKRFSQLGSYIAVPSTQSIFDSLMKIYNGDREKMGIEARKFMLEEYDSKVVYETKWKPFLAQLQKEIYPSNEK